VSAAGRRRRSWLERASEALGLIPELGAGDEALDSLVGEGEPLLKFPPEAQWDDWSEYDSQTWPQRQLRRFI